VLTFFNSTENLSISHNDATYNYRCAYSPIHSSKVIQSISQ